MKLDVSLTGIGTRQASKLALASEQIGFDGVWATESVTDGLLMAMGAVLTTERIDVSTAIVVAFARNPMMTAYAAWDLAAASNGRFSLGLGTQIRSHVERRFDMPWSNPDERLVDFVMALRAIWNSWREGKPLSYRGPYYGNSLMTPMFTPLRHEHRIRISGAAVGPKMTRAVVENMDGLIGHCFTTPRYFDQTVQPLLNAREGREEFSIYSPLMLLVADTEAAMVSMREAARKQIGFYASTMEYRPVLDSMGYGDIQPELRQLSRRDAWDAMTHLVDDVLLNALTISGTPEQMPRLVHERWGTRFDRVSSIFGWPTNVDEDRMRSVIQDFSAISDTGEGN